MTPRLDIPAMRTRLQTHEPDTSHSANAGWLAATALIVHEPTPGRAEVLFMERTEREGDRWSGQMALPGGRAEPADVDLDATARRETLEEVGVPLGAPLGRLDDLLGRTGTAAVATYVYAVDPNPTVTPSPHEVASTVWVPIAHLLDPDAVVPYRYLGMGPFPAIAFGRYTIWGLTLRTLENFFSALDHRLPAFD